MQNSNYVILKVQIFEDLSTKKQEEIELGVVILEKKNHTQ
jgi:hypothetical protein